MNVLRSNSEYSESLAAYALLKFSDGRKYSSPSIKWSKIMFAKITFELKREKYRWSNIFKVQKIVADEYLLKFRKLRNYLCQFEELNLGICNRYSKIFERNEVLNRGT